jgi:DnaA family protein
MRQLPLGVRLRDDATFASFAPGANAEVLAALRAQDTTPLWLWGTRGSGKSHLLQAACVASGGSSAYLPLGPGAGLTPEALTGFERCRVLCLDDLDAVAGDVPWERALFSLFNAAADLGTRLIFSCAAAPRAIEWGLKDWRSRAGACVIYQLQELDEAGRADALRLRAAQRGLQLPPETSEYLLRRMPRDLRSLLGILDRLDEASLVAQRRLTIPFIRDALEKLAGTEP